MGNHALLHPTEQTLSDFSLGKLDDGQAEIINNHLNECPDCQRRVAEMSSDSFLGRLRDVRGRLDSAAPVSSSLAGLSRIERSPDSHTRHYPEAAICYGTLCRVIGCRQSAPIAPRRRHYRVPA